MSIWATVDDFDVIARSNYQGVPIAESTAQSLGDQVGPGTIDVATATGWHDCIRLSMYNIDGAFDAELLLTIPEVWQLVNLLTRAVEHIESERDA